MFDSFGFRIAGKKMAKNAKMLSKKIINLSLRKQVIIEPKRSHGKSTCHNLSTMAIPKSVRAKSSSAISGVCQILSQKKKRVSRKTTYQITKPFTALNDLKSESVLKA